jgi:hypothetical protein
LFEIPMSTVRMGGMAWPAGGGGYLRLIPMPYTRWAVRQIHEKERQSVILYFHPWEIDPEQPRIAGRWKSRLRHYTGLEGMEKRLRELLTTGTYIPAIELMQRMNSNAASPRKSVAVLAT